MVKIDFVFAEFGCPKFSPDEKNVHAFFPEASVWTFGEKDFNGPYERGTFRWGNRMNDYWKVKMLVESEADIAVSMDADTKIVSARVRALIPLVKAFGLCLPANPRRLVMVDTKDGADSDYVIDETLGMGHAFNMSPIAVDRSNWHAMHVLDLYCQNMLTNPVRGPLAMWRACVQAKFFPCLLPAQWCVCAEDVGIGNEIILHVGHDKVKEFYHVA